MMNNTLSNIITLLILISLIITPVALLVKVSAKRQKERMLILFHEIAAKENLTITETENMGQRILGLDPVKKSIVFVDNHSYEEETCVIMLTGLKECRLHEIRDKNQVTAVKLQFAFHRKQPDSITFYKAHQNKENDLEALTEKAEIWRHKAAHFIDL